MPRQATDDIQWHAAIAEYRRSGLTQPEFCRRRGLPLHTFRRRLYARTDPPPAPASAEPTRPTSARTDASGFIPVTFVPDTSAATDPLVLILDSRHRIAVGTGFDPGTLRRLVDTLGGQS
jgi:hypothetical protein